MTTDVQVYSDQLLLALREREVPGPRIAEALAEVQSHVAETGEDPVDAFGPAADYAGELTAALVEGGATFGEPGHVPLLRAGAFGVGGALGGWLVLDAVLAWSGDDGALLGWPPLVPLLLGVAALVAVGLGLRRLAHDPSVPVRDPRTGLDMAPPLPRWLWPVLLAPAVLTIGLAVLLVALS